ncbi:thiamine diphosphate-binding protein [Hymenopellis radicata]|nr:thiamine diphosphate-binding protein [Hymenopellis radicata]
MLTTSSVFLKALTDVGITHAFVNWGSDHPALLEELERQRSSPNGTALKIITSPNEMVALSAAQGFAQVTGKPAAVIVHVDVGTQALAGAVHNVDRSQTPVLIYAGASAFTSNNELNGSRNEWIMWIQDVPDQSAIVRQYMRYTAQIHSPVNISEVVKRSFQIATSDPKGPVYLWARREVMEAEVEASVMDTLEDLSKWPTVEASALSPTAVTRIATALMTANNPLIITSHLGRNPDAVAPLIVLSTLLAIPVYCTCPSAVNIPFSHPYFAGLSYLPPGGHTPLLATADVVLVIESDVPWIAGDRVSSLNGEARVFIINSGDPLKAREMGMWHVPAQMICRADAELALIQLAEVVRQLDEQASFVGESVLASTLVLERAKALKRRHEAWIISLDAREQIFVDGANLTVPNVVGALRRAGTIVLNEGISNYSPVWEHMRTVVPGSMITSGGSSLGWALGAAIGVSLGSDHDLIVAVVGDGSFMFGVPSSAYWMARKYNTPFLTIVLNNGGWKSPKLSMLGVHPSGLGSEASGERLSVGFGPDVPDYSQIAVAASGGWAWGKRIGSGGDGAVGAEQNLARLEEAMTEAVNIVLKEGRCAVLDCILESI